MCSDYLSPSFRLAFACPGPWCFSWFPGFRCVEQNPRIPRLSFSEFVPATACVSFVLCFLHVRCTAHCHQQCVRAKLANRASHLSCNRFYSRCYDPYTHAWKARPPTTVGRTSLSVIHHHHHHHCRFGRIVGTHRIAMQDPSQSICLVIIISNSVFQATEQSGLGPDVGLSVCRTVLNSCSQPTC